MTAGGDLLETRCVTRGPAPTVFLTFGIDGMIVKFGAGADPAVRAEVLTWARAREGGWATGAVAAPALDELRARLTAVGAAAVRSWWHGPLFAFPAALARVPEAVVAGEESIGLLRQVYPDAEVDEVAETQPCLMICEGAELAAVCHSARRGARVHEAGLDTRVEFRRRGLGARVCAAWATAVRREGATPLYSTSFENLASQGVARRLGLTRIGTDLHLSLGRP